MRYYVLSVEFVHKLSLSQRFARIFEVKSMKTANGDGLHQTRTKEYEIELLSTARCLCSCKNIFNCPSLAQRRGVLKIMLPLSRAAL